MNDIASTPPSFRLEDARIFLARESKLEDRETCRRVVHVTKTGRQSPFKAPALVFLGSHVDVARVFPTSTALRGIALSFTDDFFCRNERERTLLTNGGLFLDDPVHRELKPADAADVRDLLKLMEREFRGDGPRRADLLRTYLNALLLKTARPPDDLSPDGKRLNDFHELVERNFRGKHRVSDYAHMLFVSGKCLNELTRKHLGKSPGDVIRERLMREARRLLESGEHNVASTARELGFPDPHYFSRFFKHRAGRPPGDFIPTGK